MTAFHHPSPATPEPHRFCLKSWRAYLFVVVVTSVTLILRMALDGATWGQPLLVVFTMPIMLSAYVGGLGAGLLATALSILGASYYLLPPFHSFALSSTVQRWDQFMVAVAGATMSVLIEALHRARQRAVIAVGEHQRAEIELRASEARMALAQSVGHFGSWELDLADASDLDANPLRWSDEMFRIAGYERGTIEVTNELFFSLIPQSEHQLVRDAVTTAIHERERYSIVHQLVRADGEVRIVHEEGRIFFSVETGLPQKIIGTARDITDERQVEDVVRMQANMLNHIGQAVLATDLGGTIIYANRFAESLYGWSSAELLGRSNMEVAVNRTTEEQAREIMERLQRGENWSGEFLVRRRDGLVFPAFVTDAPICNHDGVLIGVIGIAEDITERKQTEKELCDTQRHLLAMNTGLELRVAQRTQQFAAATAEAERANQAKSDFLSRMSHELRTPMNAILGFAQVLETDEALTRDQADSVGEILRGGRHLLDLIDEVLDFSTIEAGRLKLSLEIVDLPALVRETASLLRPLTAESSIRLVILPNCAGRHLLADRQRLRQVLLNLVSNAIKYNRPEGGVTIGCAAGSPAMTRLTVADTGAGISASDLAKLFTPFERLGAEQTLVKGTGLGLLVARRMVEQMGGTLGVESIVGEGSTFWIELPSTEAPAESCELARDSDAASSIEVEIPADGRVVLYIEDNPSNFRLVSRILARRSTIQLLSAETGALGLEMAFEHRPDLILLDLQLPDCHGQEVLRQLASDSRTTDIPVIMLTADAMPKVRGQMLAAGARALITKPIDVPEFLRVIDAFLAPPSPSECGHHPMDRLGAKVVAAELALR